jgi:hypothetical protein
MSENLRVAWVVIFRALWCVLLWLAVSPPVVAVLVWWLRAVR